MTRKMKICVAVGAVAALAAVGFAVGSAIGVGAASDWACQPDRIALDVSTYGQGGGSPTAAAAMQSEASVLAQYGVASQSQLDQALASATGATRYSTSDGMLYVNGSVVAQFSALQLPDKTWGVTSTQYCSPSPANPGSPGATP